MAKLLFVALFFAVSARAQIFKLPTFGKDAPSGLAATIEAFGKLKTDGPDFEERFKQGSLEIERQLDIMRSDCVEKTGEASQKQRCFRELVGHHKKYLESSFEAKKILLAALHKRQLENLEQSRDLALKELEKQF